MTVLEFPPPPPALPLRAAKLWPVFFTVGARHQARAPDINLPLLLAAICDTESECGESRLLDKKGPAGRGDRDPRTGAYHGYGLFQLDDRSHGLFLRAKDARGVPLWTLPEENCEYACKVVLLPHLDIFHGDVPLAIAAFNCGPRRLQKAFAELTSPLPPYRRFEVANSCTKGGNYLSRVAQRYQAFGGRDLFPASQGGIA